MSEFQRFEVESLGLRAGQPGAFCVEASAGTGKTYSITGLVLRLVCEENLPLDGILVVTFTRAAAAELRGRIGDRLAEAQRDLETLEYVAQSDEPTWRAFLRAAGEADAPCDIPFVDAFVERWSRGALRGHDPAEAHATVTLWLERVRRARQRVDAATFATIHSFCQRMLEWHAFESHQPLGNTFVENEARLRSEIANDLWAEIFESLPPEWLQVLLNPPAKDADARKALAWSANTLLEAIDGALKNPRAVIAGEIPENLADWNVAMCALRDAEPTIRRLIEDESYAAFREAILGFCKGKATKKEWGAILPALQAIRAIEYKDAVSEYLRARAGFVGAATSDGAVWRQVIGIAAVPDSDLGKALQKTQEHRNVIGQLPAELIQLGALGQGLIAWACAEARHRFAARLAERSELTLDDLITRLADHVEAEAKQDGAKPLTDAIRARFQAALIDEFQDTSHAQWTLFERVFLDSERHRIFLIGDPKQAIYGFRNADIQTYLRARVRVSEVARNRLQAAGHPPETLSGAGLYTMTRNFRSDGALIVALNRFMGALHAEDGTVDLTNAGLAAPIGASDEPGAAVRGFFDRSDDKRTGIDFIYVDWQKPTPRTDEDCVRAAQPPSRLVVPSETPDGTPRWTKQPFVVRPVAVVTDDEDAGDRGAETSPTPTIANNDRCKQVLTEVVACDIRRLLESGTSLGDERSARRVSPGDIAVLVRDWRPGRAIAARLRAQGIPCVLMSGETVWRSDEAEDLALVLQALLRPTVASFAHTALATCLFSVAPRQIARLQADDAELQEQWVATLSELARTWHAHGLLRMFSELLELRIDADTGRPLSADAAADAGAPTRREALLHLADGERRLTNLLQLTELLHAECAPLFLGPEGQLETLRARVTGSGDDGSDASPDDPRKQRLDTDDAAVRITTVHGSKGLEYPIVFLPSFDSKSVVPRASIPCTVSYPGDPERTFYPTNASLTTHGAERRPDPRKQEEYDADEESRRLLYVALTRAQHQVVLYVRDWTDNKKVSSLRSVCDPKASVSKTALGRALARIPRIAALARDEAALDTYGKALASARGDRDPHVFVGDACRALGDAINPIGTSLFDVPRNPNDLLSRPTTLWRAPTDLSTDAGTTLPSPPPIERTRFYAPDYKQGSFSSLAQGASHTASAPLRGGEAPPEGADPADDALASVSLDRAGFDEPTPAVLDPEERADDDSDGPATDLLFERVGLAGRDFGTAVHKLLETAEFAAPAHGGPAASVGSAPAQTLLAATADTVRRFGFQLTSDAVLGLATDVETFLRSPLGGPLPATRLCDIPRARRIDELEFLLPVPARLTRSSLAAAFRDSPRPTSASTWGAVPGAWEVWLDQVEQLTFHEFHGYLVGFIDLVFATPDDAARLHLLDYKTNKLHSREMSPDEAAAAYAPTGVVHAMIASRYVLQYHLYQVALYRLLRTRYGARFDWDTHMGGVWYPFLRGVHPTPTAQDEGALRRGIFYDRPPRERIEALDALFDAPSSLATAGGAP